jgi:hypothetical protein
VQVVQLIQMLVFQLGQLKFSEPITPHPISIDSSSGIGAMPRAESPLPFPQDFQVVRGSILSRQQVPIMRRCLKPSYIPMLCDELMAIHEDIKHNHRNKYKVRPEIFISNANNTECLNEILLLSVKGIPQFLSPEPPIKLLLWYHSHAGIGSLLHHLLFIIQAVSHRGGTSNEASKNKQCVYENLHLECIVCGLNPLKFCSSRFEKKRIMAIALVLEVRT